LRRSPSLDLGMTGFDEIFMDDKELKENRLPKILQIPLDRIDEFPDHPFQVRMYLLNRRRYFFISIRRKIDWFLEK